MSNNLKAYGGQDVEPGRYRVSYTSLQLVVEEGRVYLTGSTMSPHHIDFVIPLEHHTEINPVDEAAREAVSSYLRAAWPASYWPRIIKWMEHIEREDSPRAWHLAFHKGRAGDPDYDLDRPRIEQEVAAWLKD